MSDTERKAEQDATDTEEAQAQLSQRGADEFKEGGYGWVVILAVALLNFHTWGLNSTFAVFLAYYLRAGTFGNASALGYAFVGGLSISIALLVSPIATTLIGSPRIGTRWTTFIGVIFETVAFVGASFTTQLWHLILTQGIAFGIGMGFIFVATVPVPAQWFKKRRSLANAMAAAGSGFGGLTYSLASNKMIEQLGLPWTFRILAIICFVVNGICSYLVRDRNKAIGSITLALNWRLFKQPQYLLLQGWLIFSVLGYTTLVFSIVAYAEAVGLTPSQASLVGALFNMSQGLGRPIIGLSSDTVGRLNVASLCTLFCGLLCYFVWILAARTLAACIVFAVISGGVAGVMWATVGPVAAEVIGLQMLPSALSMSWLVLVIPSTFAEVIGLSLRKPGTWGYLDVQAFIATMYTAGFVASWLLRAWKVREMERAHLDEKQRERALRDDSTVPSVTEALKTERISTIPIRLSMFRALWAVQRV